MTPVQLLDIRTLSFVLIFVATFFGVALIAFSRADARMAGIRTIGAGILCHGLAFALFAGREVLPLWLTVVVGNVALVLSWWMIYEGLASFRGVRPVWRRFHQLAPALLTGVFYYHTFVVADLRARIIWISLAILLQVLSITQVALARLKQGRPSFGQLLIAVPLAVLALQLVARVTIASGEPGLAELFNLGLVHALTFLLEFVVVITTSCGVIWMALSRLEFDLRRQTRTDPLTGTLNRRAMDEISLAEVSRSQRTGSPVSVLIADIDHFKVVNDTHGHLAGDALLSQLAALLAANLRAHDTLIRYGGEEFLILLPATGRDQAAVTAEKLRALIAQHGFNVDGTTIRVEASLGVATLEQSGDDWSRLLRRADTALYAAKSAGRNRISCDSPTPSPDVDSAAPAAAG